MNKIVRIILVCLLFGLLIAIRGYVAPYFYDPLNHYFNRDYLTTSVPSLEFGRYFFNLFLRYSLNTIVSLVIIYLLFMDKSLLKFAVKFYVIAFIFLGVFLFVILKYFNSEGYMLLFYVRRFLIHPLFVVVLIPAFYYQKLQTKN